MDRDSTGRLRPHQLARLLTILSAAEAIETPGEWLARTLRAPLEPVQDAPESGVSGRRGDPARRGRPLIDVLLDPATDLRLLRVLKGRWKAFSAGTPDGAEHAGAIALYYAAIAAALVHRGTRITQYPPAKLAEAFSSLLEKPWLPHGLRRLMKTARLRCADQA